MPCNCKKTKPGKTKVKYSKEDIMQCIESLNTKLKLLESKLEIENQEGLYFKDV